MTRSARVIAPAALAFATLIHGHTPASRDAAALPAIAFNDNRVAAGVAKPGTLDIALVAAEGAWRPYGANGPALPILTFGEAGKPLQTPGPLIRVRQGTRIHASVRNTTAKTLVVHGLAAHRAAVLDTLVVPPDATRDVTFTADDAGTYYYWGTISNGGFANRLYKDAFLNGAVIVDPPAGATRPDRIFVIQWYLPGALKDSTPDVDNGLFTFNGRPWPYTERLTLNQGDSVRWRFINATNDVHPLHLHGFYYRITARGDDQRDTLYWPQEERTAVTELMTEGTTMNLAWKADRPGAWIFHCHLNFHVVPNPILGPDMLPDSVVERQWFSAPAMHDMAHHAETGMGGLVLGITIKPAADWKPYTGPRERLRLFIQSDSAPNDTLRRFGYALARDGGAEPPPDRLQWPGPVLLLHKGQPTSIWVVNHSTEPSQVHWHGLEIDSYYDGVAGLSSNGSLVSPVIMPRDSFEVTVTPPRAGSFMYHTHINDLRQQSHGLYGPIVVLDSGQTWDPEHDLIFQVATDPTDATVINGRSSLPDVTLHTATAYRIRLMNISLDAPFIQFWLTGKDGRLAQWTALAKDGHDLPPWQHVTGLAKQQVSIGETFDVRVTFNSPGDFALEGRRGNATVFSRQALHVVK